MNESLIASVQLARSEKIGSKTFQNLVMSFGSPEKAIEALPGIHDRTGVKRVIFSRNQAISEIQETRNLGGDILAFNDLKYPRNLLGIPDFPPVLSVKGDVKLFENVKNLAIVGGRNASANACFFVKKLAHEIANEGFVVTSGLARGIDAAAHLGALDSPNHSTIAAIAGGINEIYPPENEKIFRSLEEKGLIVTENPIGHIMSPGCFPRRNRIISGLSIAVLVAEASINSGSLITAELALKQKKHLFAIPAFPLDARAAGGNLLLKQRKASLVENLEDLISQIECEEMLKNSPNFSESFKGDAKFLQGDVVLNFTINEKDLKLAKQEVENSLNSSPVSIENLSELTGIEMRLMLLCIVELEMENRIERHYDNCISKKYN